MSKNPEFWKRQLNTMKTDRDDWARMYEKESSTVRKMKQEIKALREGLKEILIELAMQNPKPVGEDLSAEICRRTLRIPETEKN